jgi:hypothetical protein
MANESFNFNAFLQESKDTLLKPREYFSTMKTSGGLAEPVIKALIYGVISGVFALLWSVLHLSAVTGGMFASATGIRVFIWAIIGALIGLFIGAIVILIISAICKGSTDFESNIRVAASLMVIMPIRSAFGFLTGVNFTLSIFVGAIISLYGLYLLYHALTQSLKANEGNSKVVTSILAALLVVFMIIGFFAKRAATGYLNRLNEDGVVDEYSNKYLKELEKAAKEFEEASSDLQDEYDEAEEDAEESEEMENDTLTE